MFNVGDRVVINRSQNMLADYHTGVVLRTVTEFGLSKEEMQANNINYMVVIEIDRNGTYQRYDKDVRYELTDDMLDDMVLI